MKKILVVGLVLSMLMTLTACDKNNNEPDDTATIIENVDEGNNMDTSDDGSGVVSEEASTDAVDEEGDDNDSGEDQGSTSEEDGDTTTEGNETGDGETSETEGDEPENEEGEEPESEEPEIVEEPVDYTALISRPIDDVDYTPQEKSGSFESNPKIEVKALFITANTAVSSNLDAILELLDTTDLNALVIDVKNDDGNILFESEAARQYVPSANNGVQIKDMEAFMKKMKEHNVYMIARVVTFKSPRFAETYPEKGITYKSSGNLYYADGSYWVSPFDQDLKDYNIAVSKEAIAHGFNEIQFDYVRFPATGSALDKNLDFKNPDNHSKTYAIQEFVKQAYTEISAMEAYVALDVFGWTATTTGDSGIGQHWEGMSNVTDYMCPMVYPSHYGKNNFGIPVPDAEPYKTVFESMSDATERNANIESPAILRPWLQAFTATWVTGYIVYDRDEIQAQIQACKDLGIEDYIFWSSSNKYKTRWFNEVE